jgi:hypothetical protein
MVKVKPRKKNIIERILFNKVFDKGSRMHSMLIDMREENRRKRLGGKTLTEMVKDVFKRKKADDGETS